jgi:isopenicillin N synthase-like dioxygenase
MSGLKVVDIGPFIHGDAAARQRVAREVDEICSDIGFLVISGHAVPDALVERVRALAREFFALPLEEKMALKMPPDRYRGYSPVGGEALASSLDNPTPPDLKELFSIGPVGCPDDDYHRFSRPPNCFAANMWPERPAALRETWEEYYRVMQDLAGVLMRIFALGLGLPEGYFDDKIDRHISPFNVTHYPALATPALPGQLRSGAHSDYGSLTILKAEDAPGGLQVQDKNGGWIDVAPTAGTFIVNLGDLMAEWTNDRWVSTMHRVVTPPPDAGTRADRLSLVFFHQPNYDTLIECLPTCSAAARPPRYGRITSGEHLYNKIAKQRSGAEAPAAAE